MTSKASSNARGSISPSMEVFLLLVVAAALWLWVRVPV